MYSLVIITMCSKPLEFAKLKINALLINKSLVYNVYSQELP